MIINVYDIIVVIVSVVIAILIMFYLITARDSEEDNDKIKICVDKARTLLVTLIIIYAVYGVLRNIL